MFAEQHGIDVLELDALFSARGLGGRPKRKAKQRSMQDFVCETEMETYAESDLTNEAHFRSKYCMAVNTILADFRGRFSDTSCAIIGAMKSLCLATALFCLMRRTLVLSLINTRRISSLTTAEGHGRAQLPR